MQAVKLKHEKTDSLQTGIHPVNSANPRLHLFSSNGYQSAWQSQPSDQKRQNDLTLATRGPYSHGQGM